MQHDMNAELTSQEPRDLVINIWASFEFELAERLCLVLRNEEEAERRLGGEFRVMPDGLLDCGHVGEGMWGWDGDGVGAGYCH